MKITYTLVGDYYLPNLAAPESPKVGRWGMQRFNYLRKHREALYTIMLMENTLNPHLEEIDRQAQKHGRVMPVLVQVSPAGEPQKGGMPPEEVIPFLRQVRTLPGLHVEGLMAVMPHLTDREILSGLFANMRTLFERTQAEGIDGVEMRELSMGMSGDYDLAAAHGATMVRIGSALLGPRG
mgnify:CR=1 FL=1